MTEQPAELVRLTQAHRALSEARTLEEVKTILDVAVAARAYARARDLGEESARYAQEVVNRATRRMGEMLAANPDIRQGGPKSRPATLGRIGISRSQSSRAQAVAKLPEADFERLADKPQNRLLRIQRDRDAERRRRDQAAAEADHLAAGTRAEIRHGDFREVLADLENIDAIITDPPYPREYLPLLADLAAWADKVLTPDGVLAVLIGQTHLPDVFRILEDGRRHYRWTGTYLTPGAGYSSPARRVQSNWKPLLVYGGGPRFADVIRSEGTDAAAKDRHHWGQDYGAFHELVRRLTAPGQTVADPFAGSGTTLAAARAQGRHAIGAEIDADHVRRAREWLA